MIILGIAGVMVARTAKAVGSCSGTGLRLALANLYRPGATTRSVIMSLGLGLTVLVTVTLIEANLESQITRACLTALQAIFSLISKIIRSTISKTRLRAYPASVKCAALPCFAVELLG